MENKRFYMKREVFLLVVTSLLFINEVYTIIKITQDGFSSRYLVDLIAWGLIFLVLLYGSIRIMKRKVYIEFREDGIFYKGLFNIEKSVTYQHKYEYKKDFRNFIKKISFYGEKELLDLVINRTAFPDIKEIVNELERRVKK